MQKLQGTVFVDMDESLVRTRKLLHPQHRAPAGTVELTVTANAPSTETARFAAIARPSARSFLEQLNDRVESVCVLSTGNPLVQSAVLEALQLRHLVKDVWGTDYNTVALAHPAHWVLVDDLGPCTNGMIAKMKALKYPVHTMYDGTFRPGKGYDDGGEQWNLLISEHIVRCQVWIDGQPDTEPLTPLLSAVLSKLASQP